jgi:hypothetical protein
MINRGEIKDNLKEHIDGLKEEFLSAYAGASAATSAPKLMNFTQFKAEMGESSKS